jgi:phosphatidate cytidylyltransferase
LTNLGSRVLVAAVGIPLILLVSLAGGVYFFGFVVLVSSLALREFYGLAEAKGASPMILPGIVAGLAINGMFVHERIYHVPIDGDALVLFIVAGVSILLILELFRRAANPLINLATTIFGVLYVPLLLGTLLGVRELFQDQTYHWGGAVVVATFAAIWVCDSAAYFVGKKMGKHKLMERVSPNKSWEGAVAGFVGAVVTFAAAQLAAMDFLSAGQAVTCGAIVGIVGQCGDLLESLFKRDAGVKDSSSFIPGHGGVLDRFDSLILASPAIYVYLKYVVFVN